MTTEKLTGMSPSDLHLLARSMGYADVVTVHCSDRIAQKFYEKTKEEVSRNIDQKGQS